MAIQLLDIISSLNDSLRTLESINGDLKRPLDEIDEFVLNHPLHGTLVAMITEDVQSKPRDDTNFEAVAEMLMSGMSSSITV